jgi:hypothetical protein
MAKVSGLGWTRHDVDDASGTNRDIRNDITNMDWSTPYDSQEITGLDKLGYERLALLADASGTMNGVFNPSANRAHAVLAGDLRVIRTIGTTIAAQILNIEALISSYDLARAAGGEFTWKAPWQLADGTVPTWST